MRFVVHRVLSLAVFFTAVLSQAAEGPPSITTQPVAQTVLQGKPVTFTVVADGTAPLTYQWRRDGAEIPSATASSYTIPVTSQADNGVRFTVVVSNALSTATSAEALLRVDPGTLISSATNLVNISTHNWRYLTDGTDQGTAWTNNTFTDSSWLQGAALFGVEVAGVYAEPMRSVFAPYNAAIVTYYFRTHFTFNPTGTVAGVLLTVSGHVDDGAAFYLNGVEIGRVRLNTGQTFSSFATGDNEGGTETFTFNATGVIVPGDNVLAVEVHQQSTASSDVVFGMNLSATVTNRIADTAPPLLSSVVPLQGITVVSLNQIEVTFNEEVQGVDAADLRINAQPATSVFEDVPGRFRFAFTQPSTGVVQVAFAPGHGITDRALVPNAFAGGTWNYILDPNAAGGDVRINEFMADNQTGIRDADGDYSDWIELFNASPILVDLSGWFLSDDALAPAKWRFPNGASIQPNSYILIWASEKNRTNPAAPLHTNFRLDPDGEHLGLYAPNTNLVSGFLALYPVQRADVSYGRDRQDPNSVGYYSTPTPGNNNTVGGLSSDFAPDIVFGRKSGAFLSSFNARLALATPASNAVIRYVVITNLPAATGNNVLTNVPTASSPAYAVPFPVYHTTQIRARAFEPGKLPGTPVTVTYVQISSDVAGWSSDLPVVLIHALGAGSISTGPSTSPVLDQASVFMTFDTDGGRSSMTNAPNLHTRIAVNTRGSSTGQQAKSNFAVELWDEFNQDTDHEVLGMPEESDWVLYGINAFDQGLMHNAIFHWFGRQLENQTASRTRYVEVFRKIDSGPVLTNDYFGLYLLEEKPKRNSARLDIAALRPEDTNAPAITGGYILRIDRTGAGNGEPNERSFQPPQVGSIRSTPAPIIFDYPAVTPVTTDGRVLSQISYIQNYIMNFITNLDSVSFTNPVTGYHQYIDADQWVDNLIGNIICFNVDGYRLSGYFYKDRNGRLSQGPYWDCDRCLGTGAAPNNDNRCWPPRQWRRPVASGDPDNGTDFFGVSGVGVSWFGRLFRDPDFWQRFIDRYQMHRANTYSTNAILSMVDGLHNQIREAQRREQQRWGGLWVGAQQSFNFPRSGNVSLEGYTFDFGPADSFGRGRFSNEVAFQKRWLTDRLDFMDTNFLAMPTLSRGTELVPSGATATITPAAKVGSQLLYTLNGTDPRLPGGAVSPAALVSAGPLTLTITTNVRVFARSYNTSHANLTNGSGSILGNPLLNSYWSGPVAATYYTAVPPLRITELMYHPAPPPANNTNDQDNYEYIEVRNISASSLNVGGFRIRGGVDFDLPNVTLTAGQSAVIVKDVAAFQSRYGLGPLVLGSYSNNLANDGDHLVLQGSLREPILDFNYSDDWYPSTDGAGFALQIVSDALPTAAWGTNTSWRASGTLGGTPGADDPGPAGVPTIYINEILTHTDLPAVDAIELYNPNGVPVDVGGWFLTDDFNNEKKYRIPHPTQIGPNSYLAFNADTSFGAAFNLSSKGDEVYLFSGDPATTNLTGYVHGFDFGPQLNGVTFGRYVVSTGNDQHPAQSSPTLGSANAGPKVGPIVISEIMFRPPDVMTTEGPRDNDKDEYIEIANLGPAAQPLYDPLVPASTWQLRDAVDFTFPPGILLLPGERVLVVSFDPATDPAAATRFRALHGLSFLTRVFGPFEGQLDNSGDSVELTRPDAPQPPSAPDAGAVYQVLADKVNYSDASPWPTNADGTGLSLQRVAPGAYGNDPTNWVAATASPGNSTPTTGGPVFTLQPQSQVVLGTLSATLSAVATGAPPVYYQWYLNDVEIPYATSSNYVIAYLDSSHQGTYRCRAINPEGSTLSSSAILTVVVPATITLQPTNVTVRVPPDPQALVNRTATFRVGANSSNPPLTFQWQLNGTNLPSGHPNFLGVTTTNLVVTNVLAEHGGTYRCAVTDLAGTVYSLDVSLITQVGPLFILQPQSQTILQGDPVTFTVGVSNASTGPFNYVWRYQSQIIASNHMVSSYFNSVVVTNVILQVSNLNRYRCDVQSPVTVGQGSASGNAFVTVLADLDRDRLPDFWELQYGLSTNNAADALLDLDGDLMSNLNEYNGGTDPTDPASVLRVTDFLLGPAESAFSFLAISNRTYSVQAAGVVPEGPWLAVTNVTAAPSNRTVLVTNAPALPPPRYIRIVTPQQP